jgi:hypothetical protein
MKILDFPTELLIHIFFYLRRRAEEAPSPGGCLGFVNLAQTCRRCYSIAEDSIRKAPDLVLTEKQKAHITLELGESMAKSWMKTFTPIAAWARRVGRICAFCANKARHSLHGEAFTGLMVCRVCEALLLPKVGLETLWNMNRDNFSSALVGSDSPYPGDEPELWRPYPFAAQPPLDFETSPVCRWIPVDCETVWEIQARQSIFSDPEVGNQLTTWTHAKKVLTKYEYVDDEPKSEADPYMVTFYSSLGGILFRGPLAVGREATWWFFRADKYHWRWPVADIMHEYGKDSSLALYLEFRYQFDPWWHDNKTLPEMYAEFCRIRDLWVLYREVPWQEDQWPITPPKIPLGANDKSTKGNYEAKCKGYQDLCSSLRRRFWRDDRLIEKPAACWKAIREIKSNRRKGTWNEGQIMKKQKRN